MARFFHNTLRVPHIQNATEKVRVVLFFIRGFAVGCLLLQLCVISIALLVRFKLGFPVECSGVPEKVYSPLYALMGTACAMWLVLVCTYFRINSLKKSGRIKIVCVCYLALNILQFFVILVSRLHSSGYSNRSLLQSYSHVFSGQCLVRLQLKDSCCGFQNYTEWFDAHSDTGHYEAFIVNPAESSDRRHLGQSLGMKQEVRDPVFPSSCWCLRRFSSSCVKVSYKIVYSNKTNYPLTTHIINEIRTGTQSSIQVESHFTESRIDAFENETNAYNSTTANPFDTSNTMLGFITGKVSSSPRPQQRSQLHDTPTDHAHIFPKPCLDSLLHHFKTVDISAAVTAVVSSSVSLAVFLFGYFLIHNLEGAVTVNDIFSATSVNKREDNSSTSSRRGVNESPQFDHTVIVLNQIAAANVTAAPHDLTHFQVSRTNTQYPEVALDEKDIHMILPD